jgi:glutaminyl-peptide cyclotransferase
VEIDEFVSNTPQGEKTFRNIIATWNRDAPERVILAAHYDSKYFPPPRNFVAATDSAAPCAILLDIARSLDDHLSYPTTTNLALQLVFFDGEEAFGYWTHTDSIYGARHLASKWATQDKLSSISVFVLLDLIGAANPKFHSYWPETDEHYGRLRAIENSLSRTLNGTKNYFQSRSISYSGIEDDHLPFLERGVNILHLICNPFPRVWHTDHDNLDAIDLPTLADIATIMRVFVAEILGVRGESGGSQGMQHEALHSASAEVVA